MVSGLEFFVFSLVDVAERKAYPLAVKQTVRSARGKKGDQRAQEEAGEEVEKDETESERA